MAFGVELHDLVVRVAVVGAAEAESGRLEVRQQGNAASEAGVQGLALHVASGVVGAVVVVGVAENRLGVDF